MLRQALICAGLLALVLALPFLMPGSIVWLVPALLLAPLAPWLCVRANRHAIPHPDWEDNLSLALNVQKSMAEKCGTLPRMINLRQAAFNQGLCSGSLLFEIGSSANTLTEAKRAAVLTALSIAETIKGEPCRTTPEEALYVFAP